MNSRISAKERGLLKGAIRRVFSRSELRRIAIENSIIQHSDDSRKRVKTWCLCANCKKPEAKSNVQVDHILPVIPTDKSLEQLTWDEVVDRIWCEPIHLQVLCTDCHDLKTKAERKERTLNKKKDKLK